MPKTTLACVRYLREMLPSAKVSVEVEKPGREGLRELAAEADLVFYSRTWAEVSWFPKRTYLHPLAFFRQRDHARFIL